MITIYHNPRCSKSRQTLALLEERGIKPHIVLYLETPPDRETLQSLLKKLGMSARELLRTDEDVYRDNFLENPAFTESALIDAMIAHPKLIQRPIVVNGDKARLGRPPEQVLEIL